MATTVSPSVYAHAGTSKYFKFCAIYASIGGTFFGFDQSVVSNSFALPQFNTYFHSPDANEQGNIVILFIVGGIVGAFLAGRFSDQFGRLFIIGTGVAVFTVGATILTAAVNVPMLYVGRVICGLGCGAVANNTPLYLSEITPANKRGRYTSLSNVMEDLGFALIAWVSFAFSYVAGQASWRLIFACQYIGSIVLIAAAFILPSSPRWLGLKGRDAECLATLAKLHANGDEQDPLVQAEFAQIQESIREEKAAAAYSGWIELFRPGPNLRRLTLALCLPVIQQFTGINAITYYAPTIFASAGIKNYHYQILLNAGNTTFGTIISLTALYTLDRYGRRGTLIAGILGMTCLWILVAVMLKYYPATDPSANVAHGFIVLFIWLFYSTYVATWGPCGWWLPMEILPTNLRAKGAALSTSFTFLYNLCVSKTTPLLFVSIGYKTYFYYAGLCALSTFITLFFLPETNGLSLEELDTLFHKAPYVVWWGKYRIDNKSLIAEPYLASTDQFTASKKIGADMVSHVDELSGKHSG